MRRSTILFLGGGSLRAAPQQTVWTDMGTGTSIDVTKAASYRYVDSAGVTLTFSATPATGTLLWLELQADSTARTVTIPTLYSLNRQSNITSVTIPANGTLILVLERTDTLWRCLGGDPGAVPLRETFRITFDPKVVCDGAVDRLHLMTVGNEAPNGINILAWRLSFEADPTTEFDANAKLKRAGDFINLTGAADMDILTTTAGVASESNAANINGGATVANGQVIYIALGTAYIETNHQVIFEMEYSIA